MERVRPPIRAVAAADLDPVSRLLARAFDDDPVVNWVFRDRRLILEMFRRQMRSLYLPKGFGHMDGVAATLWTPPGAAADPPMLSLAAFAARCVLSAGPSVIGRMLRASSAMSDGRPAEPHYYLFAVGVEPSRRGEGYGGRIIREGLSRADAERAPAYLENSKPRNTPLYERLGFIAADEIRFAPDAPPMLPMRRPAKTEV